MKVQSLHTDIYLEPNDYFWVRPDGDKLKVILTNGNRRPVNLREISRRQAYALIARLQQVMLWQDSQALDTVEVEGILVAEDVDTGKGGVDEKLLDEQD